MWLTVILYEFAEMYMFFHQFDYYSICIPLICGVDPISMSVS